MLYIEQANHGEWFMRVSILPLNTANTLFFMNYLSYSQPLTILANWRISSWKHSYLLSGSMLLYLRTAVVPARSRAVVQEAVYWVDKRFHETSGSQDVSVRWQNGVRCVYRGLEWSGVEWRHDISAGATGRPVFPRSVTPRPLCDVMPRVTSRPVDNSIMVISLPGGRRAAGVAGPPRRSWWVGGALAWLRDNICKLLVVKLAHRDDD